MLLNLLKKYQKNIITIPLIDQLIKAGTSVGGNYCEADCAESRRDFEHKLGICKKESKEIKHWLRMIAKAVPKLKDEAQKLLKEADELQRIFIAIIQKSRLNKKN